MTKVLFVAEILTAVVFLRVTVLLLYVPTLSDLQYAWFDFDSKFSMMVLTMVLSVHTH